jgi:catechol 2,3-dioxygenase-like lactoylglutathione lyase family enzyme
MRVERVTPILRVDDARAVAQWYAQLGFEVEWEHRFEPDLPLFVSIRAGEVRLFLSEHAGDARPDTLVYLHVDDVDAAAAALGAEAKDMPWGMREVAVTDPAGNRLRLGREI